MTMAVRIRAWVKGSAMSPMWAESPSMKGALPYLRPPEIKIKRLEAWEIIRNPSKIFPRLRLKIRKAAAKYRNPMMTDQNSSMS